MSDLIAQDSTDTAHRRDIVFIADRVGEQLVAYLPREDARVLLLVPADRVHDPVGRDARLAAAYCAW